MSIEHKKGGVMGAKVKDFRTGSLKGLKAVVEDADYDRLFPKNR